MEKKSYVADVNIAAIGEAPKTSRKLKAAAANPGLIALAEVRVKF